MVTIKLGLNTLEPDTWTTHEVEDLEKFLLEIFPAGFPKGGRIFHEQISVATDVTPDATRPETIQALLGMKGLLYVLTYPEGLEVPIRLGILVGALVIDWLLNHDKKHETPPKFATITGSPNNQLGNRKNTARVLGRIPDIFGDVRAFPDLLALPYISYSGHREVEVAYLCVGRGTHIITDIRDGDMLVGQIEGMSTVVYPPGESPGGGIPDITIGEPINEGVFIVKHAEAVNGQILIAPNAKTIIGDSPDLFGGAWRFTHFRNDGPGFGFITVGGEEAEIKDKVKVGDKLDILFPSDHILVGNDIQFSNPTFVLSRTGANKKHLFLEQGGTGPLPDLTSSGTNTVTVVAIIPSPIFDRWFLRVSIPAPLQAAWDVIDTYTASTTFPGVVANGGALITAQDSEWVGPFFVEAAVPAPREQTILCNFVAQNGLYADDGKNYKGINVRVEVEITPADANGTPTGDPIQLETTTILGTRSSRNTRAVSMKITPVTPGNFLVRARRLTRTPWKQDSPSQYLVAVTGRSTGFVDPLGQQVVPALAQTGPRIAHNTGSTNDPNEVAAGTGGPIYINSSYLPFQGNAQDEIAWTHCYSLVTTEFISFGDLTTIHTRTVASTGATRNQDRRLNCFARRLIQTWDGATFGGALVPDRKCENILFTILADPYIGNLDTGLIDYDGIAAAFEAVRAAFGGPTSDGFGGDEAGEFNFTFDDAQTSLEETISMICNAGFCTPYREGDFIRVKPEIATTTANLVVNHRNRVPGTEQRTVTFGTEADFDGVRIDYTDVDINSPTNYAVKTYTIPPNSVASRPRQLQIPGIRLKKHAAWHAWRAYNRLLYANTLVECQVCEEGMGLRIEDRVLMSDSTRRGTQDGEIVAISGSTVTTSQPVNITSGPHTLHLQHSDGTVEGIAVVSSPTKHQLVLATPPAVTLVTDSNAGVRTMYVLFPNDTVTPTAYLVKQKNCTSRGTWSVTLGNYSHAFYWNDGMMFWLPMIQQGSLLLHRDWGPYELSTSSSGGEATDAVRGRVYEGSVSSEHISITTSNVFAAESYTKSAWVYRTFQSTVQATSIISSVEDDDEQFLLSTSNQIQGIHGGTLYVSYNALNSLLDWHMYSMTYDAVSDVMRIYYDGEIVDEATSVPGRGIGNLRIFGNFAGVNGLVGRGDDVRYWMRVLEPEEIRELYRKTFL